MAKVTLQVMRWTYDHETSDGEEPNALLLSGLLIDGQPIAYTKAELSWDGPGAGVHDEDGNAVAGAHDFLAIGLHGVASVVRERYPEDKHLDGTTAEILRVPIDSFEIVPAG